MPDSPSNPVKTSRKTLTIVEELTDSGPMALTELASAVGLGKSVVHNHLRTLASAGYVRQYDDESYGLSFRFLEIGGSVRTRDPLYQAAEEHVQALAEETGELSNLMTEEAGEGVYLYRAKGEQAVNLDTFAGKRVPIHTTALGKAILAHRPRSEVESIIDTHGLSAATEQTITDPETLFEELATVRERGYAIDNGERVASLRCLAAPVTDQSGYAVGAISISGPRARMQGERFETTLPEQVQGTTDVVELNLQFG
jgi:DNA-binding IclR family transcriptional regulator